MKRFKKWMEQASVADKKRLAKLSFTSTVYLYQIASGTRRASAEKAAIISKASYILYIENNKRTGRLERSDICPACAACPYSPKCGK